MVTLVTTELAPEVQMRPPEVMKVSKRDFNWPFKLSHVLQDGNLRTKFPMPSRLKDCSLMTLGKKKMPADPYGYHVQWVPYERLSTMFDSLDDIPPMV